MAENCEILNSTVINLKSVVQSCKGGVALRDLENDYKFLIGSSIPLGSLGYKSLDAFLRNIPEIVKINKNDCGELMVEATHDSSTAHLAKLISKQKDKQPKKPPNAKVLKATRPYLKNKYRTYQSNFAEQQRKYALSRSTQCKNNTINQISQRTSPRLQARALSQRNFPHKNSYNQGSVVSHYVKCDKNITTNYINRRTSPRLNRNTEHSQRNISNIHKFCQEPVMHYNSYQRNSNANNVPRANKVFLTNNGSLRVNVRNELVVRQDKSNKTTNHETLTQKKNNQKQNQIIINNPKPKEMIDEVISQKNDTQDFTDKTIDHKTLNQKNNNNKQQNEIIIYSPKRKETNNEVISQKNDIEYFTDKTINHVSLNQEKNNEKQNEIIIRSPKPKETNNEIINQNNDMEEKIETTQNLESHVILIQNLVRPFTMRQLKELLSKSGNLVEDKFWIDKIKSKCFATYESEEEAIETKKTLNGLRWPTFSPKTLLADFSTEENLNCHMNDIPPPKPASKILPPTSAYEHSFLDRVPAQSTRKRSLKSESENIPPTPIVQSELSPKVTPKRTKKRKSLQRFGPFATREA